MTVAGSLVRQATSKEACQGRRQRRIQLMLWSDGAENEIRA
jgi:hypothetical protein